MKPLIKQYQQLKTEKDACGIGAVCNITGQRDHRVLTDALSIVEKLEHRAGKDATGKVGDGVGILTQISHTFFKPAAAELGIDLREAGDYGIGMFFFPQDQLKRTFAKRMFEVIVEKEGLQLLGWRDVPVRPDILGGPAALSMPRIMQCFIERPECRQRGIDFDRRLYVIRREFEQSAEDTYICSLSSRTIVYKGMFLVGQLRAFYDDLRDERYQTAVAIVHSRFSTNTTPSWERAHPYRMIAHNGEINTIRGNIDRMFAREETMNSRFFKEDIDKIYPVIGDVASDSAMMDNTLEFLTMNGIALPLAMMILVPEPWKHDGLMKKKKKDFYHYYATMMEPWDGPAALLFTDGDTFGATLDRNGLRPSRYIVTDDGRLILSSEAGVIAVDEKHIVKKSRLEPGKMLIVDTKAGKVISDETCKESYASLRPYGEWLDRYLIRLRDLRIPNQKIPIHTQDERDRLYRAFGYTYEDVFEQIMPMARTGNEPIMSMGHDVPLAVLSDKHPPLFHYFKQLFAQVTNPPIDALREKTVTDTTVTIGSDGDLLDDKAENCRVLEIDHPILTETDLLKIRTLDEEGFRAKTVSLLYYKHTSLSHALRQLNIAVDRAAAEGKNLIILSDRGIDENHVAIPSLLAVSSVEQHLVETKKRTAVSLILESGEPRDVHQMAALLGFGARAVNPYLAHECIGELVGAGLLNKDTHTAILDYDKALLAGVVKTAAKMGISTLQSYQSARIFEAIGLSREVTEKYFMGTGSQIGGIDIADIEEDVAYRHDHAFDPLGLPVDATLDSTGFHSLRSGSDAEDHMYNPKTLILLQQAVREGNYEKFKTYSAIVDHPDHPHTIRGLLDFAPKNEPVDIHEVEPVSEIVRRFQIGAMSYGSLSKEAHTCLAKAMNRLGGRSNTGEGGEAPERFGTEENSAVKQVASGRFGVTSAYLSSAKEIQIKMAQGAKPGEGGHLPGKKVYPWVANVRFSTPGVSLISPPPHHDIYSIEDLAELIYDLKNANKNARISVKLVSEPGVGTIAAGVAKAGAQVILISGYDGGTGAAPYSSIHHAGLPWELGVREAHQSLTKSGLRERVVLETDGKLMTGRDVAIAALSGAEEFGFATAPLVAIGCMMMRVCAKDTCPAGIATQDEKLRARFAGKPEYVMRLMRYIAEELREIMASLGFKTLNEMIGRTDCLKRRQTASPARKEKVDITSLLRDADGDHHACHCRPEKAMNFHLEKSLDESVLIPAFHQYLKKGETTHAPRKIDVNVTTTDRAFGTRFGSVITQTFGDGLEDDSFVINAKGGGGQSFGAFLPKGVTIRLTGDANDGFGKGLSGGKLVIMPPTSAGYSAHDNVIIGNVALYGATSGTAYVSGIAGERFMVRNSGAVAVCEGCGDHGLEYMTGGRAVILGMTGKNFAAGMSGGIAYVYDKSHTLYLRMNKEMDRLKEVTEKYDIAELKSILTDYVFETQSVFAKDILDHFEDYLPDFKKIIPKDYQAMLTAISKFEEQGIPHEHAVYEAFLSMN